MALVTPDVLYVVFESDRDDRIDRRGGAVQLGQRDRLAFAARERQRFAGEDVECFDDTPVAHGGHGEGVALVILEEMEVDRLALEGVAVLTINGLPWAATRGVNGVPSPGEPGAQIAEACLLFIGDDAVAIGSDVDGDDHVADSAVGERADKFVAAHDTVGSGVGVSGVAPGTSLDAQAFIGDDA